MKRFYCSTALKKGGERRDQHCLMKGSSPQNAATAKRASFHLSAAPSLSRLLSLLFLLSPAACNSWRHTVEPHQEPYREFTRRCMRVFSFFASVISWDALHNGCQRCLERDSCTSCCFAELSRNVCASGGLCASAPRRIIVCRFWPTACCFLWDVAFSNTVSVSE